MTVDPTTTPNLDSLNTYISHPHDMDRDYLARYVQAHGFDWYEPRYLYDAHGSRHPEQPRAEAGTASVTSYRWTSPHSTASLTLSIAVWSFRTAGSPLGWGWSSRIWARLYIPNDVGPVCVAAPVWDGHAPCGQIMDLYTRWMGGV